MYETHLPTEQLAPQAHPRFPRAHGQQARPPGTERPARQGPGQTLPVTDFPSGFPAAARLHTPAEFTRVFRQGVRSADACFNVFACRNDFGSARLGIVVARRAAPRAVTRSRLKRCIRESFRVQRAGLPAVDVVVQARPAAAGQDNITLRASLAWHWREIARRCASP